MAMNSEFVIYCRSRELRAKTLESYEHTLRLFERWCNDELNITQVDQVTESVIRRYITNLQERGKYTFYANEKSKEQNFPERRRDFRKPVSAATINNYIRNLKVFFNWLDSDYVLKKNPMKKVRQHVWRDGKCVWCGAAQSQYDRDKELESHAYEFIHVKNPEDIFKIQNACAGAANNAIDVANILQQGFKYCLIIAGFVLVSIGGTSLFKVSETKPQAIDTPAEEKSRSL